MKSVAGGVSLHLSCHSRAQNMGQKAAEMLSYLPEADVKVIERCSGHNGTYAVKREFHETSMKIGRPVAERVRTAQPEHYTSDCPMAGHQIENGLKDGRAPEHPLKLLRQAYGLDQPLLVQLWRYVLNVGMLDLGFSHRNNMTVLSLILTRLPATYGSRSRRSICRSAMSSLSRQEIPSRRMARSSRASPPRSSSSPRSRRARPSTSTSRRLARAARPRSSSRCCRAATA